MSLAQSCCWKPHAVIHMLDASLKNVDCELAVPSTFGILWLSSCKAPFGLTMEFSEEAQEKKQLRSKP